MTAAIGWRGFSPLLIKSYIFLCPDCGDSYMEWYFISIFIVGLSFQNHSILGKTK